MELTVGTVLEGKVKSITNFGAFVALPENKTGMVHISEVANTFVSDIRQHLTEGQDVKVMVIGNENGKINLSIKRLEPKQPRENTGRPAGNFRNNNAGNNGSAPRRENGNQEGYNQRPVRQFQRSTPAAAPAAPAAPKTASQNFEDMMKAFMTESDSKLSGMRADHRTKSRRR